MTLIELHRKNCKTKWCFKRPLELVFKLTTLITTLPNSFGTVSTTTILGSLMKNGMRQEKTS